MPRFREAGIKLYAMPNLSFHGDTGQWKSPLDGAPHMRRLILRQLRRHPLGVLRSVLQMARLGREARKRD